MRTILIIGAGAIGRAFLPWIFKEENPFYIFIDTDTQLINTLQERQQFTTYMSRKTHLDHITVSGYLALHLDELKISDISPDVVFICVGPRNVYSAFEAVKKFNCPIVLAENDIKLLKKLKKKYERDNVYFSIPDVIASNTAPSNLIQNDPLAVVTEAGVLYIQEESQLDFGELKLVDQVELQREWVAKLYVHNTPHCITAYLGFLNGNTYIHEAMADHYISNIVRGVMDEMINAIVTVEGYQKSFLEEYATKEVQRFSDSFLFDTVCRVAREPLRKLEPNGRLLGAVQLCLEGGVLPRNLLLGVAASLMYDDNNAIDLNLSFLRDVFLNNGHLTYFLSDVLNAQHNGPLYFLLKKNISSDMEVLTRRFPQQITSVSGWE